MGGFPTAWFSYEGANDLTWAFGNSQPYRHAEFQRIASKFNRSGRGRGDVGEVSRSWEDWLAFVAPRLGIAWQRARFNSGWPQDDTPAGLDRLAREAVQVCLHNQRIVESLGRDYGFDVHSFWQPYLIYDRKPLAPGEEAILNQSSRWVTTFRPFAQAANEELAREGKDRFVDLSDCFSQVQTQLFTDMVHVTPEGNELVARAMLETVEAGLRNRRQPVPPADPAAETQP